MNQHDNNNDSINALYSSNQESVLRFLQQSSNNNKSNSTNVNDAAILRNSFVVYGSIWLIALLIFCWLCQTSKYYKAYTIRNWVDNKHKTSLAQDKHGFLSWMRRVFQVNDEKFMLECGMDALCLTRIMNMGRKLSIVCAFNAIWLFPLYITSPTLTTVTPITDYVAQLTISNVPEKSLRMLGTVLASYIVFGYTMYVVYKEFDWFIAMRHKFLSLPTIRNYSVFIRNVPDDLCDDAGVYMYFKECFTSDTVVVNEVFLRVATPELTKWVNTRTQIQQKLEHAIALQEIKGVTPTHKTRLLCGKKVDSITTYAHELNDLNDKISTRINELEKAQSVCYKERAKEKDTLGLEQGSSVPDDMNNNNNNILNRTAESARGVAKTATNAASSAVRKAGAMITGGQDGKIQNAGFLTFFSLRARQSAMQIVHHARPFTMQVTEAPEPADVLWSNVGRKHRDVQLGKLFSYSATATICLLWTIPIAFFASLSSVRALRAKVPFVDSILNVAPYLGPVLEILAPFLVVVVNGLLPTILRFFTHMEGEIANSFIDAALFTKLAYFMIIQTFFVSAISGSILNKLSDIIDDPKSIIKLLATSLPTQSTYFIQILIVYTAVSVGLEVLGIPRVIFAYLRRFIGPNLTEKERNRPFFILRPLGNPSDFEYSAITAQMVLYMIVLLVYAPIAPLTSVILVFLFWYMEAVYRHQFIYIYPKAPDSGGLIWMNFIRLFFVCIFIAEFNIVGLMALKEGVIAVPLMVPLIIITFLFSAYVSQQHYRVMTYLPSHECLQVDKSRGKGFDVDFLDGAYVQPEMQEKFVYPENLSIEREVALGLKPDEEVIDFAPASANESSSSRSMGDYDDALETMKYEL